jgi:hypothetical protein
MTANQLVARNLKRAREAMGQTQEIAAQRLEPYLGRRWSVASFSDAERSALNGRTREFSANELVAFARAFEKPIAYFFEAPDDLEDVYCGPRLDVSRVVSRKELEEVLPAQPELAVHATELRRIADELDNAELRRLADG